MEKLLLRSQKELVDIRISAFNADLQRVVLQIAEELGLDIKNEKWELSADHSKFVRTDDK